MTHNTDKQISTTLFTTPTTKATTGITSSRRKQSLTKALMMASAVPLTSLSAFAAETTPSDIDSVPNAYLPTINVYANSDEDFKKDTLDNVKYTQPLVDVPQTIAVVTGELIEEQKAFSLVDALRNTPGITMQMGENGRSNEGDSVSLRGFSGDDLFLVDGIRNIAAVSRDTFNVDSVEITKGAAGAELGRAATGGAINLITKKPKPVNEHTASVSVDSVANTRVTADLNQVLSDSLAGRLNLMYQKGDTIGRDLVDEESIGIAPSVTWGLGTPTRVTTSAELLRQRNTPDGGISTVGMDGYFNGPTDYTTDDLDFSKLDGISPEAAVAELNAANKALNSANMIDKENYYGDQNDFEDVDSQLYTVTVEHDFDDNLQLTNTSRYANTTLKRELSAPYQAYNSDLFIGRNTNQVESNQDLADLNLDINDPSTWVLRTIRQGVDRENTTIANQTNINILDVKTGSLSHDFTTGIELLHESQENKGLSRPDALDYVSLYEPNPSNLQSDMFYDGSSTEGSTKTLAGYVFDTITVNDKLKLTAGLRADNYHTTFESTDVDGETNTLKDNDTLLSYKGAVVFKPTTQSSIYGNYGVTQTPPGSNNFSLSNAGRGSDNPSSNPVFDPQDTKSWEIGTKMDLLNDQLTLGLAYYNTTHENELASKEDGSDNFVQFGERSIQGVELYAQGQINPRWRINAGIQTLDTEIKDGDTGRNAEGAVARWSPELTGTLWTSYDVTDRITLGGGARYVGEQTRQTDPSANFVETNMPVIPEYWAVNAYASYRINDALSADLNVYNVFDEEYIETLNNGGGRVVMGEPLNALVTLKYKF